MLQNTRGEGEEERTGDVEEDVEPSLVPESL